jgi:hypothetical protein
MAITVPESTKEPVLISAVSSSYSDCDIGCRKCNLQPESTEEKLYIANFYYLQL